jgi:4-oxalomesaconate tautomerase
MLTAIPCTLMRGGTSKGLFFAAADLPAQRAMRDQVLLAAMGSPDVRQIDGLGGAHPLTSKVAVIERSARSDADVDYLFLQVAVAAAEVSDSQSCGNILAAVGPWAIEQALVPVAGPNTPVRIHMVNSASLAVVHVPTPAGAIEYEGAARIDGVPGTAAPIAIEFLDVAGSTCGALLPTGNACDVIEGVAVTCIDNGMPVVLLRASDLGKSGYEEPAALAADGELRGRLEALRQTLGPRMNLGDVTRKSVPKMCMIAPAQHGGALSTRTFTPHHVHEAIGVLGAVSVATACMLPESIAAPLLAHTDAAHPTLQLEIEHPSGSLSVEITLEGRGSHTRVRRAALLRTARKLMHGELFIASRIWQRS